MHILRQTVAGVVGSLMLCVGSSMAQTPVPEPTISQFSGQLVPRFASLRYADVNGRTGPSLDHPIAWRYEKKHLPVLILKESFDWRWVRDPDGDTVWIHKRMLTEPSHIMVRQEAPLYRRRDIEAPQLAILEQSALVEVMEQRGGWVKVDAGRYRGWMKDELAWGMVPDEGSQ